MQLVEAKLIEDLGVPLGAGTRVTEPGGGSAASASANGRSRATAMPTVCPAAPLLRTVPPLAGTGAASGSRKAGGQPRQGHDHDAADQPIVMRPRI